MKGKQLPLEIQDSNESPEKLAIVELAECVKEMVRIVQTFPNYQKVDSSLKQRLVVVYTKATKAKSRVEEF